MEKLIFIIDNSYSVLEYKKSYLECVNKVIEGQRNLNENAFLSVYTFNDWVRQICKDVPIKTFGKINFECLNMTALYDSLVHILKKEDLSSDILKNIIVLTDGDDTSSVNSGVEKVKKYVLNNSNKNCRFIFLGITSKSLETAKLMGFKINILYDTSKDTFLNIPTVVSELFKRKDIDELDFIMSNLKI